jgi:hypothetical protein
MDHRIRNGKDKEQVVLDVVNHILAKKKHLGQAISSLSERLHKTLQ